MVKPGSAAVLCSKKLRGFKKRDFDVKLGSVLLPEVRDYYREKRFSYLEEKLGFEKWGA